MLQTAQLQQTLHAVASGAALVRYVVQARSLVPGAEIAADLFLRALLTPLSDLEGLFSHVAMPPTQGKRHAVATASRRAKPQKPGLPKPVDLHGLDKRLPVVVDRRFDVNKPDVALEASNCRALLLEIIRRAAYDWVLYRGSSELTKRQWAESAYYWLFEEDSSFATWATRERDGKLLTGFITICAVLDLDPSRVRKRIRSLTTHGILSAGRPAEKRKGKVADEVMHSDDHHVFDVDVSTLPLHDCMFAPEDHHS